MEMKISIVLASLLPIMAAASEVERNNAISIELNSLKLALQSTANSFAYGTTLSRMPTNVGSPSYSGTFKRFDDQYTLTFWREAIDGRQRLFVKLELISESAFICGNSFSIIQNEKDYGSAFALSYGDGSGSVCATLRRGSIFLVDQWPASTAPNFNELGSFQILHSRAGSYYYGSINVGASTSDTTTTTTPASTTTTCTATATSSTTPDRTATYDSGMNIIKIPRLSVPTALSTLYYSVDLELLPLSDPMTFKLKSATPTQ